MNRGSVPMVFETGVRAGTDVSCGYLERRFDAICLACGAREPRDLSVPGRDFTGIFFAMDFLVQQNKRLGGEPVDPSEAISARDKRVVIIGGGDTGSDCLGTSLRQGAKEVCQFEILPKPPVERPDHTPWPLWPQTLQESHAHKEGGKRLFAVTTRAFLGENRVVTGLDCAEVAWVREHSGGPLVPKDRPGTGFTIPADLVILAMGFTGPGNSKLVADFGIGLDERGNVKADENRMTSVDSVFVAGDMSDGQSLVVRAIASGKRTANGIIAYLRERGPR